MAKARPAAPPLIDGESGAPRYRQLMDYLVGRMATMKSGDPLPSIRDLIGQTGLSHQTVVHAMEELEHQGYLDLRVGRGAFVAHREKAARTLHPRECPAGTVILALPAHESHWLAHLLGLAETEAVRRGHGLLLFRIDPQGTWGDLAAFIKRETKVAGVMVWPPALRMGAADEARLESLAVPAVVFSPPSPHPNKLFHVSGNPVDTGAVMARALLKAGHEKLAFLRHEPSPEIQDGYEKGIREAMAEYSRDPGTLKRFGKLTPNWGDSTEAAYQITKAISTRELRKVTGLIYTTSVGALGGIRALAEKNIVVPDAMSVIGSSDHPLLAYTIPSVSATDGDWETAMAAAFDMLKEKPKSRHHMVATKPVLRGSIKTLS